MVRVGSRSQGGLGSALRIRLLSTEHLPDHSRQFSHDRHTGNRTAATTSNPFVPFAQPAILLQGLVCHLS